MPDSPDTTTAPASASKSNEQARIRRERREAKIRAGGASRLNKITGLGGGLQREEAVVVPKPASTAAAGDPDEVDISEHFYEPQRSRQRMTPSSYARYPRFDSDPSHMVNEDMTGAIMMGMSPGGPGGPVGQQQGASPFAAFGEEGAKEAEDPMMAMLQQMLGGGGAVEGQLPSFPGMPPMKLPGQHATGAVADPYAYVWRLVHALFAIGLGTYIALTVSFTGSKLAREESALLDVGYIKQLFWMGEATLLGRFFFKSNQGSSSGGIIGTVLPMIPQPYGGYIKWTMRYSSILRTIWGDALMVVFTLGAMSWWNNRMNN